jgi:hypothetical protein
MQQPSFEWDQNNNHKKGVFKMKTPLAKGLILC